MTKETKRRYNSLFLMDKESEVDETRKIFCS
jgi:hypothetical protein